MRTGKLLAAILIYHVALALGVRCRGGRSARGVSSPDELHTEVDADSHRLRTASCCEEDTSCHGGYLLAGDELAKERSVYSSIEPTLSRYAQRLNERVQQRRKRSVDCEESNSVHDDDCNRPLPLAETSCCSANVSVFFPISAISAKTGKRVHVIQAPPIMLQAVVFSRCESDKSPLLDADCQQEFVAEMMHVAQFDDETQELRGHREPVLLESGCSCRMSNREPPKDGASVDDTVAKLLAMW